jgi:hypothetical protein
MSENGASAKTEPYSPTEQRVPTGYRVYLLPGALEICARLGTPEEVRNLIKVLRAGILILQDTTEGDMDEPLSLAAKRATAVRAASKVAASPK